MKMFRERDKHMILNHTGGSLTSDILRRKSSENQITKCDTSQGSTAPVSDHTRDKVMVFSKDE